MDEVGLHGHYIATVPSWMEEDMKLGLTRGRIVGLSAALAILALGVAPGVWAAGTIACLSPASCANTDTLNLGGPGTSQTATFWLYGTNVPAGNTVTYYVCPASASSCGSASGNIGGVNGWVWTFAPTSGTVASNGAVPQCVSPATCEGNGLGNPSILSLTVTAPTTTGLSNNIDLEVYACTSGTTVSQCNQAGQIVASLGVTVNAPEFGAGMAAAVILGLAVVLVARRRNIPSFPTPVAA